MEAIFTLPPSSMVYTTFFLLDEISSIWKLICADRNPEAS